MQRDMDKVELSPCWFLHAIENRTPSPGGTHMEEPPMTTPFKHENVIKLAGVLGVAPELRLTANGNAVATLIVYTNYILRNEDGSTRQESERHRVIVWGLHAEKAARLLRKGSKIRVQGRMTYPTWKDKQTGATRYGAEIVAQTLDYQGANDEDEVQIAQPAAEAPVPQPTEPVAAAVEPAPAKPKRSRSKKAQVAAA
jgi:single-strand DNA-binding protein